MNCRSPKNYIVSCPQLTFTLATIGLMMVQFAGCVPAPPAYLRDNGNLNFYLEQATQIEYPDVDTVPLDEVISQRAPITITDASFDSFWDLSLEESIAIALQNTKVIRGFGTPGLSGGRVAPGSDSIIGGGSNAQTMYNVAIRETEPGFIGTPGQIGPLGGLVTNGGLEANQGVEAALADFDAQVTSVFGYERQDIPRNVFDDPNNPLSQITPSVFVQDQVTWQTELAKRSAEGTQFFVRSVNSFTENNIPAAVQPLRSFYQTALEAEIRQPLLRGRGAFVNRMPVVISRIQTDQEIASLEAVLQNKVTNVEIRYWDLSCAYRNLETAKTGRDAALDTWRMVDQNFKAGKVALQDETEAREQYYFFRAQVEAAFAALLDAESDLRWLMGVAITDGRLVRPTDDPVKAWVAFDWCESLDEALSYRPELRQERWEVRKKQLQVAYSKNSLLPSLNATGLYRWQGLGDKYANYGGNVPPFPSAESGALNDLFGGDYQEFRVGVDFGMSVGFRRELANVRNAQLKLAEQIAILEDMELDVSRELSQALRALDLQYELIQSNFNRWVASTAEVDARFIRIEAGSDPISFLLDSQRRRAQGEQAYYQALCEYNKLIALIHRRKGTILAYSNVFMAEGPWTDKAYHDARENSRRRSASRHVDYGWTRPEVISQGEVWPTAKDGCDRGDSDSNFGYEHYEHDFAPGIDYYPGDTSPSHDGRREVLPEPLPRNIETLPVPQAQTPTRQAIPTRARPFSQTEPIEYRNGQPPSRNNGAVALLSDQNMTTTAQNSPTSSVVSNESRNDSVHPAIRQSYQSAQQDMIQRTSYQQ